jgi:hypothetical protein
MLQGAEHLGMSAGVEVTQQSTILCNSRRLGHTPAVVCPERSIEPKSTATKIAAVNICSRYVFAGFRNVGRDFDRAA